jgi:2-C-methyl-D-erythritol 4-phosphate cytidylyltransferase
MPKTAVIVVGAGQSARFGGEESKIFAKVDGQPLFLRALQLFVNRDDVCQLILVVAPNNMNQMKTKYGANLAFMGVRLVEGGAQRADSVSRGLESLTDEAEYVAVHDAVRPCLAAEWIDAIIAEAVKSGAAIPSIPVNETLKTVSKDHVVEKTVSREGLWIAQTPQVFRRDVIESAYRSSASANGAATDDAQLVESSGHAVTVVLGDPRNIKITTKDDLTLASAILKTLPQPKRGGQMGAFEEARW